MKKLVLALAGFWGLVAIVVVARAIVAPGGKPVRDVSELATPPPLEPPPSAGEAAPPAAAKLAEDPPETLALERALAMPGAVAMGSIDMKRAATVPALVTPPDGPEVEGLGAWVAWLRRVERIGIDPAKDIDRLFSSAWHGGDGALLAAVGAAGRFDAGMVKRTLGRHYDVEVVRVAGKEVLRVHWRDEATCERRGPWGVIVGDHMIVATTMSGMEQLAPRLGAEAPPTAPWVDQWVSYRRWRVVSAAWFSGVPVPASMPGQRVWQQALKAMQRLGDGWARIAIGLWFEEHPGKLNFDARLDPSSDGDLQGRARDLRRAIIVSRLDYQQTAPSLLDLLSDVAVAAREGAVTVQATRGGAWLDALSELVGQSFEYARAAATGHAPASVGGATEERLDLEPLRFAPEATVADLGTYDTSVLLAKESDTVAGPFGLRIESVDATEPSGGQVELTIKAIGTRIPNLGDGRAQLRLVVDDVFNSDAESFLASETCELARARRGVPLTRFMTEGVFVGEQRIRLPAGTGFRDVWRVVGSARATLPTATRSVALKEPKPGAEVKDDHVRLVVSHAWDNGVAWRVTGRIGRLLHVRALNARGQPLQEARRTTGRFALGQGIWVTAGFRGRVAGLEVILADEEVEQAWSFELRPFGGEDSGAPTAATIADQPAFVPSRRRMSIRRIASEIRPPPTPGFVEGEGMASSGPFALVVGGRDDVSGKVLLDIRAACRELPNLAGNIGAVQLSIERMLFADGRTNTPPASPAMPQGWNTFLRFLPALEEGRVAAETRLEPQVNGPARDVLRVEGKTILRIPGRIDRLEINPVDIGASAQTAGGRSVRVQRISGHAVTLSFDGPREDLVAINPFDVAGRPLHVLSLHERPDEGKGPAAVTVGASAPIASVVVHVGADFDGVSFPFTLTPSPDTAPVGGGTGP